MGKQSNENESIFKETMGEDWMEKNDSFFDRCETEDRNNGGDFNMFKFICDSLFNFF